MIVLSKGFKLPQTGDLGDVWFPALEDTITQLNSHSHNGVDSEQLSSLSVVASKLTVASGSFSDQGNGYWRATVNMPSSNLVDNFVIQIKDPTTKDPIYLKMEKLSATQFYIFTNTVQDVEVYFGV